jgi:hypothetical protein
MMFDALFIVGDLKKHSLIQVSLEQFLTLTERDLREMGVDEVGVRKRLLDAVASVHKKDWQRASLPKITPRDKQAGIYVNCPDCVAMVASVREHAVLLGATADFLRGQIEEHPELLSLGQDVAGSDRLATLSGEAATKLYFAAGRLERLKATVSRAGQGRGQPADAINPFHGSFFVWSRAVGRGFLLAAALVGLAAALSWGRLIRR